MKFKFLLVAFALFVGNVCSYGQIAIPSATPVTQNFDGLGTSATAALPTGIVVNTTANYSTGTIATTLAYGSTGTGAVTGTSSGGCINWANGITASATDRSLGFLNTGSYSSPRAIIVAIQNTGTSNITDLTITFDYEKYRSGSRQFDWTFFHGATATAVNTAATAGDLSSPADAVNTTVYNPPTATAKTVTLTGLTIAPSGLYYLCWKFTGLAAGSTNGQGFGIDNLNLTATFASSGITTANNGDWYTGSTWTGGVVPTSAQTAIVNHTVTATAAITRDSGTATTINVGASLAVSATYTNNGTTTVNGTFQLDSGGWATGTNFVYGANSTLIFNATYTANSGAYWPTTAGPINVTVTNTGAFTLGFNRTVTGVFQTANSVTLGANTLTLPGTCQVNVGGSFANAPIYTSASTLIYNGSGAISVSSEWTGNSTTAGTGIPQNVTIQNSATVSMPNSNRGMAGNLNISSGTLTLNATSGDLYLAGNWTRASTATFTPSNRAVFFNGSTTQNLTVSATGTETFNYLLVQGSGTLKLAAGTNVVVNVSSGLTLGSSNGTSNIDLNGQTLTLSSGGNLDLSAGNRNITSTLAGGKVLISTADLTVTNGGTLTTDGNTTIDLQKGLDCGTGSLVTINGTLQMNVNGFCTGNSPRYGASSLLQYNNGSSYARQLEWTSTTAATGGVGAPNNVQISNNTTLNYYNASNNGPKAIVGNLVVDAGATFSMGSVSTAGAVTIPGNVTVAGTLSLCNSSPTIGDDLKTGGNLAFTGAGSLVGNERAIFFTKTGTQTVSSVAALTIPFVVTAGTGTTVQLLSSITISSTTTGVNVLTFGNAADVIDLNGFALTLGSTGNPGIILGTGSFKGNTTSSLTLLGTGNIGTVKFVTDLNLGMLTMNRTGGGIGCTMGSAVTLTTALTLTAGLIDLAANVMTLAVGVNPTGIASSYIIADVSAGGVLRKNISAIGAQIFPIGSGGTQYTPATINFASGTMAVGAYIGMAVENNKEPNLDATSDYINRYWEVTSSGITSAAYSFVGTFITGAYPGVGDISGTGTTGSKKSNQWDGVAWLNNGNVASGTTVTVAAATTLPATNHFTAGSRDAEINIRTTPANVNYLTASTYNFGSVIMGTPVTVTFEIQNLGQQTLTFSTATLSNSIDYATNYAPGSINNGNAPVPFTITFTPPSPGAFLGSISIVNNDASGSENPYVINFTGDGVCATTTNTITPTSGAVGTEVTITATANNLTGAAVTFLGTAATSVTYIDATHIKAIVPATAPNGLGTLTTTNSLGCQASNSFTVDKNLATSCQGGTNPTELFMSEVTDASYGGLTYVEIYNGTGASVNLGTYSLQFFANGAAASYGTVALSGTIANGATYTVSTATSGSTCTVTGGDGSSAQLVSGIPGINFEASGNDNIALYNGATKIDNWGTYMNSNWGTALGIGDRGVDFRRKNTAVIPNSTFSSSDWDIIDWGGTGVGSCSTNDYSNIGTFNFLAGTPPTVTVHPAYTPTCKGTSLTVAGTEGFAGGNPLAYQWYGVAPNTATWTTLTNAGFYTGSTTATLTISDISSLIGYQYYCQIRENTATCYSASNAVMISAGQSTTWDGSIWSNSAPNFNKAAVINGNYSTTSNGSFEACSVYVNSPNVLTIASGNYVAIQNDLTVVATGNVIVQDDGSLVQIADNGVNTGSINVNRTETVKLNDYVYWSSPVASFATTAVSPGTSSALIWKWNPTIANSNNSEGSWQNASADSMLAGKGYIIRAPNTFNNTTAADYTATFIGTPFNGIKQPSIARGDITTVLGSFPAAPYAGTNGTTISEYNDNMNLVGNPYPCSINAINFLTLNTNILGNIRLWTHGSLPTISTSPYYGTYAYNYAPGDYITYNSSGVSSGPSAFSGYVASGQGFFVTMNDGAPDASQTVTFNNAMRSNLGAYYDNSNFYRNAANHNTIVSQEIEKDRIWLDLIDQSGVATRTLVGYIEGATMAMDRMFDANITVGATQNLYSLIDNKSYSIQGRALPFDSSDTVPLGVKIPTSATYTIAVAITDGLFHETNQSIYLEDTALNIIHDLREAPYVFTSESGRFDTRFVLRYTNPSALGTVDFDTLANSVVVSTTSHNQIDIKSYAENMNSVVVYDILGRVIYNNSQVNLKELEISNVVFTQQAFIVKITLENGFVVTKKILLK